MSLLAEMNEKALKLGLPISVHLDVTYRCNERCVNCYRPEVQCVRGNCESLLRREADPTIFAANGHRMVLAS